MGRSGRPVFYYLLRSRSPILLAQQELLHKVERSIFADPIQQ